MFASVYRRYVTRSSLGQQFRSSLFYELIFVACAFAWAFAVAWFVLPHSAG